MLRGGGSSGSGSLADHPPPPPPVWRPCSRPDPSGFKAYWTQETGSTTWSHESLDLLQAVQTDPQPTTSSIGLLQQGKSEVVYAVKEPCASGLTTRRMRLVLLPEDDEAEPEDESETRFCERELYCRGSNSDTLSGWLHRGCTDRHTLQEITEPERVAPRTDLPPINSTLCPSLSSRSGCPHKHNRKCAQISPNRLSLSGRSGCLAWCCFRRGHGVKSDPGKLALCSSSSLAGPGAGSPFRSGDFFRDGERIGGMRRRRPDEARRLLRGPVLVLFVFIGIALAAVGVAVGFILINTNLLNKSPSNQHSQAIESAANRGPTDYVTVISSLVKPVRAVFRPGAPMYEAGWAYYSKGSVNGSKYHVVHKAMTYSAAQEQCKRYDGYLARINSVREQVFIEDFIQQELDDEGGLLGGVGFWIGARRARGSHGDTCMFDQWKWIDAYGRAHGTISGFTAFVPGKPDNYYSPEECLFLSYRDRDQPERFLKWDDAPCDLNSMGGIKVLCEVEMTSR